MRAACVRRVEGNAAHQEDEDAGDESMLTASGDSMHWNQRLHVRIITLHHENIHARENRHSSCEKVAKVL
ncbi:hypothetical protein PR002_g23863 [Phytophthora rubi]|uniref:Uncharacterized protein n=1 Tax=Phytophthora rubi TaxID=129364 RepID=A0A6A3IGL7_9STRA|nr:hypothetical protein PR002_g23863 [Phytophthora rubi]